MNVVKKKQLESTVLLVGLKKELRDGGSHWGLRRCDSAQILGYKRFLVPSDFTPPSPLLSLTHTHHYVCLRSACLSSDFISLICNEIKNGATPISPSRASYPFFCPAIILSYHRFALPLLSNVLKKNLKPFAPFTSFVFSPFLFPSTFLPIIPKYDVCEGAD